MKRILFLVTLLFAVVVANAQGYVRGRFIMEGDYNRTAKFEPSAVVAFDGRLDNGNGLTFGYKAGPDKHFFNLAYQIGVDGFTGNDFTYIENRYLYRYFKGYHIQEFNAMFSLGYRNIHWDFKLGLCNRYIAEIPLRKNGGEGVIFEPMNVVFDIEYNLFSQAHPWNIGCGISNYREFIIERVTLFYYTFHGYYNINEKWRIISEAGLHPAGVLNLSSQYNGFFFNIGCTYNY